MNHNIRLVKQTLAKSKGPQDLQLATPAIDLGKENSKTTVVEDPKTLDKVSKFTGPRGSKLTTPRIALGEENPKTSFVKDSTTLNKVVKSNASRASHTLRISLNQSEQSSINMGPMVTSTPIQQKLFKGPRASIQSKKIAINARYVVFVCNAQCEISLQIFQSQKTCQMK